MSFNSSKDDSSVASYHRLEFVKYLLMSKLLTLEYNVSPAQYIGSKSFVIAPLVFITLRAKRPCSHIEVELLTGSLSFCLMLHMGVFSFRQGGRSWASGGLQFRGAVLKSYFQRPKWLEK